MVTRAGAGARDKRVTYEKESERASRTNVWSGGNGGKKRVTFVAVIQELSGQETEREGGRERQRTRATIESGNKRRNSEERKIKAYAVRRISEQGTAHC